ncbi:MAG: DNA repair protein RecO [Candidatus Magasanikbacteria bacterium]|nr:DNA repair protein RecO [Candidatus Magasanikbacteria bacterium]
MQSIILSRRDFREFDQIISVYTKEKGKAELLARGVKKITSKNSAHLESFSFVDIEIAPGKGIGHLTKVQPINYFVNIRQDLQKSLSAGYVVSLLDKILHVGEKDGRIFELLRSWLDSLNIPASPAGRQYQISNIQLSLDGFIVKLLNCLGYDITQVSGLDLELKKNFELLKNSDWGVILDLGVMSLDYQRSHEFIYNFLVERLERKVVDWGQKIGCG